MIIYLKYVIFYISECFVSLTYAIVAKMITLNRHVQRVFPKVRGLLNGINRNILCKLASWKYFSNWEGHCETSSEKKFCVAVEGNIGSGKTTFLQYFSKFPGTLVLEEPVTNWRNIHGHNLLNLMYSDPHRWSMTFQSYVQLTMLQRHKTQLKSSERIKLMERSIFSARYCFVENLYKSGLLSVPDYVVLSEWFNWIVSNENLKLDLIVYLQTRPETVFKRIKQRCRLEETNISLEYLTTLHNLHEDWLLNEIFSLPCPVLVIDANCDLKDMENILKSNFEHILCLKKQKQC